jgi:hypothetical protein
MEVHFVIQSGTGAYGNIHGVGTGAAVVDFVEGTLIGIFCGRVPSDPREDLTQDKQVALVAQRMLQT